MTQPLRTRANRRKYGIAAAAFIKEKKRCALFVDPGLGKTAITLDAFVDLTDELELWGITLIIAPPAVSRKTWSDEMKLWDYIKDKSYTIIEGSMEKRRKLLQRRTCFHIISIELLPWLLDELGGHAPNMRKVKKLLEEGKEKEAKAEHKWLPPTNMPYQAIVVDEASKLKSYQSRRWKALRLMAFRVEYFVELTGTPAANGLQDLWALLYLIDRGERLGQNITAFRNRWCKQSFDGHGYTVQRFAHDIIEERISDVVFTLREEDYADLPKRMYNNITVEFDPALVKKYRQFERTFILETDEKEIRANQGAALSQKLQQLANGTVYDAEKGEHDFHDLKLQALQDLVDELNGKKLLVAYAFKSDVRRIKAKFKDAVLFDGSGEMQDRWNRGEIPMMLVHPRSAAHGLNLQFGGHTACWYSLTWSLEDYIQLNKRLHRSGQVNVVMIHHLIVRGTIDEDMLDSLDGKHDMQEALLNALKKRIKMYKA
jgi:SNF2 family DNA or RNA helicase